MNGNDHDDAELRRLVQHARWLDLVDRSDEVETRLAQVWAVAAAETSADVVTAAPPPAIRVPATEPVEARAVVSVSGGGLGSFLTGVRERAYIMTESLGDRSSTGRRVVGAERASLAKDLVRRYKAGESIRSLASATGRSYGFIHRVLTEAGVQLRQRGGARRRRRPA